MAAILRAWNIGEDSVVFVDDSPTELAEVAAVFPGITTLRFPSTDPEAAHDLFQRLREYFGKPVITNEDSLRAASIRTAGRVQTETA